MAIQRRIHFTWLVLILSSACGSPAPGDGKALFEKNCKLCHGTDGKKMMGGAPDLSISALSREENIQVILNGRGTMPPFAHALSAEDAGAVADYIARMRP